MIDLWSFIRVIPHRHSWGDTRLNGFYTATEQQCSWCKKYRHHLYQDRFGPEASEGKWRHGRFKILEDSK